ncbi:hypothetical protein ACLB2K_021176 [Fragaria x ananassa]
MDFYFFEISLVIVAVIVTWMGCKAIKGIWTRVKRRISYMVGKLQDNQGVQGNIVHVQPKHSNPCKCALRPKEKKITEEPSVQGFQGY